MRHSRLFLTFALVLAACSELPTPPEIDESLFYLVLYPGESWDGLGTFNHYAMALQLETTVDVRCAPVGTLDMRRRSDGAPFAWHLDPPEMFCGANPFNPRFPRDACCTLPFTHPDSLGGADLRPGEEYTVAFETDFVSLQGSTTIPGTFSVAVVRDGDRYRAVWTRSAGAAAYAVNVGGGETVLTTDTSFVLPESSPERFVTVEALDRNYYRYVSGQTTRAGIDAGQGVFGAVWGPPGVPY